MGRHPEQGQQPAQGVQGADGLGLRVVAVQVDEELPVREVGGQPVRGMDRESGLADSGHPADRVNAHHTARCDSAACQQAELPLPPGERGHVTRQGPHRRGGRCGHDLQRAPPRRGLEARPLDAEQGQRAAQQPDRLPLRGGGHAPFEVADRPQTHPGRIRQLLLSQPCPLTLLPQLDREPARCPRHRPPPPVGSPYRGLSQVNRGHRRV